MSNLAQARMGRLCRPPNTTFDRTAGSHGLAAAGQRERQAGAERMRRTVRTVVLCTTVLMFSMSVATGLDTSRVNSALLKGVVKVTALSPAGVQMSLGTGFLVSRGTSPGEQAERRYYLVTNKHMLGDWTLFDGTIANYFSSIEITFYGGTTAQPAIRVPIPIVDRQGKPHRHVRIHKEATVDVAAVALTAGSLPFDLTGC